MSSAPRPETASRPRRRQAARPSANGANRDHAAEGAPSANGDNGRDARGRFTKGNPGGPGNPFARRVAALRRSLCETVTEEDIRAMVYMLRQRAVTGDVAACKLLFAYTIGRPAETVDPDTVEFHEFQMYRRTQVHVEDLEAVITTVSPQLACALARGLIPAAETAVARSFLEEQLLPDGELDEDATD